LAERDGVAGNESANEASSEWTPFEFPESEAKPTGRLAKRALRRLRESGGLTEKDLERLVAAEVERLAREIASERQEDVERLRASAVDAVHAEGNAAIEAAQAELEEYADRLGKQLAREEQQRLDRAGAQLEAKLDERVARLEADLGARVARLIAEGLEAGFAEQAKALEDRLAALEATAAEQPKQVSEETAAPPAAQGSLHLNKADVEDLRGFGLSLTQSRRVLAQRDKVGGFSSVDDLDEVPGIPAAQRSHLKSVAQI
jgi:DNA uptake protein ComE-like DNA-binding protein